MKDSSASTILLATDFSESAGLAQLYAGYLAVALKASVVLLHVSEHRPAAEAALRDETAVRTKLQTLQDSLGARAIPASIRLSRGNPGEQIVSAAREFNADFIAIGAQGHTDVRYGLIGATVNAVTTNGPCPVLAVPLPHKAASPCLLGAPDAVKVRRILAPVDFSVPSLDSLDCAIYLAGRLSSDLVLLHVLEPVHADWDLHRTQGLAQMRAEWESRLGDVSALIRSSGSSVTYDVRPGCPADSILAGALQHHCDLIVMGTHGRRGRDAMNVGSVAEAVLKQGTCPIMTVRIPKGVPGGRSAIRGVLSPGSHLAASSDRPS
jgi:nucleotide-binding universal stress UspA family protein